MWLWIGFGVVLIVAVVIFIVGLRSPEPADPMQTRLAEFGSRDKPVTLEEIELSQPFTERILLPNIRRLGDFSTRFTPQASLEATQHKLDLAGNPGNIGPTEFWAIRIVATVVLGGLIFFAFLVAPEKQPLSKVLLYTGGALALGYFLPALWLGSKISRRQNEVIKAMPDALDLLTICVEAGLGFDAAMSKVNEKWENDLALAFGRVIQEIRLGKPRRDALRDMSARIEVPEMTTFVAAIIQAEQLGVSIAKVLRIQSDQMRIRRRQRAEEKAHQAPIKMLFPMAFLIFPTIYIVLLGPAALILMHSAIRGVVGK
ncbi:MAG: type II secretion system F family protein [Chloroflexi bacterium]|nr:type II secretion system F family protein [Chloroflexota bacterium]MBI3763719.1 type II secretion system F family protein [Chloroflexota bacterium]